MNKRTIAGFIILLTLLIMTNVNYAADENIVNNPGFEQESSDKPLNWDYTTVAGTSVDISNDAFSGSKSIYFENSVLADTMVFQGLNVEKGKLYKVSAWVKADIKNQAGSANITLYYVNNGIRSKGIYTSPEIMDTKGEWKKLEFSIRTSNNINDPLTIALRLGGQGVTNEGKAYFDDVEFIEINENEKMSKHFEFDDGSPVINDNEIKDKNVLLSIKNVEDFDYLWGAIILIIVVVLFYSKIKLFNED